MEPDLDSASSVCMQDQVPDAGDPIGDEVEQLASEIDVQVQQGLSYGDQWKEALAQFEQLGTLLRREAAHGASPPSRVVVDSLVRATSSLQPRGTLPSKEKVAPRQLTAMEFVGGKA